jgi:hypothetical protein
MKTFNQISPKWAGRIKNRESKYWGAGNKELLSGACCVVGEAHGFSGEYTNQYSDHFCRECESFSLDFCTPSFKELDEISNKFTQHWNEKHI